MGEIKLVNKNATKNEIKVIKYPTKLLLKIQLKIRQNGQKFCNGKRARMEICPPQETIQEYDFDKDGKLNTAEYHQVLLLGFLSQQICFLSTFWPHFDHILTTFWSHFDHILTTGNGTGGKQANMVGG